MRNANAAQWILELVTSPDRADAITGDLIEESPRHGAAWFWFNILRTAASHVLQDFRASPGRMFWLGLWGFLEWTWFSTFLGWIWTRPWMSVAPSPVGPHASDVPAWSAYSLLLAVFTAGPLLVGWDIARLSKGRELAAALAGAFFLTLLSPAQADCTGTLARTIGLDPLIQHSALLNLLRFGCSIAGALLYRRQHLNDPGLGATHA